MIFILQRVLQSRFMNYMQEIKFIYNRIMLMGVHGAIVKASPADSPNFCTVWRMNGDI